MTQPSAVCASSGRIDSRIYFPPGQHWPWHEKCDTRPHCFSATGPIEFYSYLHVWLKMAIDSALSLLLFVVLMHSHLFVSAALPFGVAPSSNSNISRITVPPIRYGTLSLFLLLRLGLFPLSAAGGNWIFRGRRRRHPAPLISFPWRYQVNL
jgi:hypothetical protein